MSDPRARRTSRPLGGLCPGCQEPLPEGTDRCPACNLRLLDRAPHRSRRAKAEPEPQRLAPAGLECSRCYSSVAADDASCPTCGGWFDGDTDDDGRRTTHAVDPESFRLGPVPATVTLEQPGPSEHRAWEPATDGVGQLEPVRRGLLPSVGALVSLLVLAAVLTVSLVLLLG